MSDWNWILWSALAGIGSVGVLLAIDALGRIMPVTINNERFRPSALRGVGAFLRAASRLPPEFVRSEATLLDLAKRWPGPLLGDFIRRVGIRWKAMAIGMDRDCPALVAAAMAALDVTPVQIVEMEREAGPRVRAMLQERRARVPDPLLPAERGAAAAGGGTPGDPADDELALREKGRERSRRPPSGDSPRERIFQGGGMAGSDGHAPARPDG